MRIGRMRLIAGAAVAVLAIGGGTAAYAASGAGGLTPAGPRPVAAYACEKPGHVVVSLLSTPSSSCPAGTTSVVLGAQGPAGAQGAAGQQGAQGAPGAKGDPGTPGASYQPATQSAVFTLTGRPDSGNGGDWAKDDITRTATVTRHGAVPAGDCGSPATSCWFFTMTVSDTGTFTTDPGASSPDQSAAGTKIAGILSGNIAGGGNQQFYADSSPQMPTTLSYTGSDPLSTSSWYKLFFAGGTNFGDAPATSAGAPWTSWSWSYTAPATCETWTDAYNNGDGNQAADGNVAGVNACTA